MRINFAADLNKKFKSLSNKNSDKKGSSGSHQRLIGDESVPPECEYQNHSKCFAPRLK